MFELIIRYTQQTSEDTWSLRHRSFRSEIPGLEKEMAKYGAHVVDVNKVETPKNKEDSKNNAQQAHTAICSDPTVPYGICSHFLRKDKKRLCRYSGECKNKQQ